MIFNHHFQCSQLFYYQNIHLHRIDSSIRMKESRNCHTCQKSSFNLMNAICGHKICFTCVKNNKNTYKCSQCSLIPNRHTNANSPSPPRNVSFEREKEKSTKAKDSEQKQKVEAKLFQGQSRRHPETKLYSQNSPLNMRSSRKTVHKSSVQAIFQTPAHSKQIEVSLHLFCKEHHQPLTMFCKSTKELICSICLCNRSKLSQDILPLKGAEDYLRKQSRVQRDQSRFMLNNIDHAQTTIKNNIQSFKICHRNHQNIIQNLFKSIYQETRILQERSMMKLEDFFTNKFQQCEIITNDLNYLSKTLKQYRESNKENCSLSELVYNFTSFKVIKQTVKVLDLDFLSYGKDVSLMEINKYDLMESLKDMLKFKLQLPLKYHEKRKRKSSSNHNKSTSRPRHDHDINREENNSNLREHRGSVSNNSPLVQHKANNNPMKRHQMSLCGGNAHGMEMGEQEKNLYKMLLKTKFKA